jgi:predicted RNA binding protein YcfA (HicA-like mRNA interferase family)
MPELKKLSGQETVKILCNRFGFSIKRQKGSHVLLVREDKTRKTICVVPMHRELKIGTLKSILKQACISEEEFSKHS